MPKRAGRPPVDPKKVRTEIFRFVTTKAEAGRLRNRAEKLGLSISEYLRSVAIPKE